MISLERPIINWWYISLVSKRENLMVPFPCLTPADFCPQKTSVWAFWPFSLSHCLQCAFPVPMVTKQSLIRHQNFLIKGWGGIIQGCSSIQQQVRAQLKKLTFLTWKKEWGWALSGTWQSSENPWETSVIGFHLCSMVLIYP